MILPTPTWGGYPPDMLKAETIDAIIYQARVSRSGLIFIVTKKLQVGQLVGWSVFFTASS